MKNTIDNHVEKIQKSIDWINANLNGEKKKVAYSKLVDCRRKLNRIKSAIVENPAAAMYGESQMGKSYLVSGLLSTPENPFNVVDNKGGKYNFIKEINPRGDGGESTSLVTRFSLNYKIEHDEYPVKVKLLSIKDIVLLLCDTYYNDVKGQIPIDTETLDIEIKAIEKWVKDGGFKQKIIQEDDILDIRDYFKLHFLSKARDLENSNYFEKISLIISQIEVVDWESIFSLLWNKNKYISEIFNKLLHKYKEIDFVNVVYIPYDAVLRDYGTLLDVARLNEITQNKGFIEVDFKADANILYLDLSGNRVEKPFPKSYLCAIASELIFRLPEELRQSKRFLIETDLLDFPGARARLENYESDVNMGNIPQMLLRGKVAYLFNSYSENYRINCLLFCQGKKDSVENLIPELLNRWICDVVGGTPEIRQKFVDNSIISPLFIIGTMFNLDLQIDHLDNLNNANTLNSRWSQRFTNVLEKQKFNTETYDWFNNWTTKQSNFQNIYLLRDFYFSSEAKCQLFKGYNSETSSKEIEEIIPYQYPSFLPIQLNRGIELRA